MKTRTKAYGTANSVGREIERIRLSKGISQTTFISRLQAAGLDINPTSYSKIEGQLRRINDSELFHIARLLQVPMEELFRNVELKK